MPVRLRPLLPTASEAILVGDPRRAFALAQEVCDSPKMSHQARGLWGYTGIAPGRRPLTVQSTGIGGPSAVTVLAGLHDEGLRAFIRLGTCSAVDDSLEEGACVLVEGAIRCDGTSAALGARPGTIARPDPGLLERLSGIGRTGIVASHDLTRRVAGPAPRTPAREGPRAIAEDLQTAALLTMAERLGMPAAAVLIVTGTEAGDHMPERSIEARAIELSDGVAEALTDLRRA